MWKIQRPYTTFQLNSSAEAFELRISSDRDDRMGAKIKTQKNPWTKIYPPKNPMFNFRAITKISRKRKII